MKRTCLPLLCAITAAALPPVAAAKSKPACARHHPPRHAHCKATTTTVKTFPGIEVGVIPVQGEIAGIPLAVDLPASKYPMLAFTITNATTRRKLATFRQLANETCSIDDEHPGGTAGEITFYAPGQLACHIRSFSGPVADRYTITAAFAGSAHYRPSMSEPESFFSLPPFAY